MMWVLLLLLVHCCCGTVIGYVDPFIGSGGQGYGVGGVPPGAQLPFSTIRLSPDTSSLFFEPWARVGGYHWNDNEVRCFSHLHMQGAGVLDMGIVSIMPTNQLPDEKLVSNYGYRSFFEKQNQKAQPGYFSVLLDTPNVFAELTSAQFAAGHRYTWRNSAGKKVLLFPSHGIPQSAVVNASVLIEDGLLKGHIQMEGGMSGRKPGGVSVYFVYSFNASIAGFGVWNKDIVHANVSQVFGNEIGGYLEFEQDTVEVQIGISYINTSQALVNLNRETKALKTFNDMLSNAQNVWEKTLSSVIVGGQAEHDDLVKFYTALYHSLCAPTTLSEDRLYLGFDDKIHELPSNMSAYYTDMSLWDVYRDQFQLLSLLFGNSRMGDIVQSLLLMTDQGGSLPQWPFVNVYTCSMIGQHAQNAIADAYLWGVRGFNADTAFETVKFSATQPQKKCGRNHMEQYDNMGYIPNELSDKGSCLTLAYAHNDFAIASFAKALNRTSDYQFFLNRSLNYINVWDKKEKFFCPRSQSGEFKCPFIKVDVFSDNYVEGDAWHYRFFGTDPLSLYGADSFKAELSKMMNDGRLDPFNVLPNPYYWMGNEPDIDCPWQFAYLNASDLTFEHVKWVAENRFSTKYDGIPGNDDYGATSSWLVWAYMGIYPLYSGKSQLSLSIPLFESIKITRDNGNMINISRIGNGKSIKKLLINGEQWEGGAILPLEFLIKNQRNTTFEFNT